MALASRIPIGRTAVEINDPCSEKLNNVVRPDANAMSSNGIFSSTKDVTRWPGGHRFSGQKSSTSRSTGNITTAGLLIRARANINITSAYRRQEPAFSVYQTQQHRLKRKKKPLSTSFRSPTQATDSTRSG